MIDQIDVYHVIWLAKLS